MGWKLLKRQFLIYHLTQEGWDSLASIARAEHAKERRRFLLSTKSVIARRELKLGMTYGLIVLHREFTELGEDRLDVLGSVLRRTKEVRIPACLGDAVVLRLGSHHFSDAECQL